MFRFFICSILLGISSLGSPVQCATDEEIRSISEQIWAADSNRMADSNVQYDINGTRFFTYVNETALTGTYQNLIALLDNYNLFTGNAEACGQTCLDEESAFLDAIMNTGPIQLLHDWLVSQGLASSNTSEFKNDLYQYWFMLYTRSDGILGSCGFENTYVGEIDEREVKGFHNWVQAYYEEQAGNFIYGPYIRSCEPTIETFGFDWLIFNKPSTSAFIRTSPEVEIALSTLCLLARTGNNCPIRLEGIELTMTALDMTGVVRRTIDSAYPNC